MNQEFTDKRTTLLLENHLLNSGILGREVCVDMYLPKNRVNNGRIRLLLFNDGQLLRTMSLEAILNDLYRKGKLVQVLIAGIFAGPLRRQEYGTAGILDFAGRGNRSKLYTCFILEELLPFICGTYGISRFAEKAFAGFSLGGLSALDIVWNNPREFSKAGVFSGSLWWRTRDLGHGYVESVDRIMHNRIRAGTFVPGLKFFFECGTEDEQMDRNGHGRIDSVNDTEDLIGELEAKGYRQPQDIRYVLVHGGMHHEITWASVLPDFLVWGWGRNKPSSRGGQKMD
ncbi:MAG TPA: alpha/beta hydrolase-fold protein [Chitinophagaceae bacterium]|nr:alpha/beta hydrolase-fold protein [Chitinophagaceae bacterium]